MQADIEINKKKNDMKNVIDKESNQSRAEQKFYQKNIKERASLAGKELAVDAKAIKNSVGKD